MEQYVTEAVIVITLSTAVTLAITAAVVCFTTFTAVTVTITIRATFLTITTLTIVKSLFQLSYFSSQSTNMFFVICRFPLPSTKVTHCMLTFLTNYFSLTFRHIDFLLAVGTLSEGKTVVYDFGLDGKFAWSLMLGFKATLAPIVFFLGDFRIENILVLQVFNFY